MPLFYMPIDGALIALRSLAASQIGLGGITIRMEVKSLLILWFWVLFASA